MRTDLDNLNDDVIDLGVVSEETKGGLAPNKDQHGGQGSGGISDE